MSDLHQDGTDEMQPGRLEERGYNITSNLLRSNFFEVDAERAAARCADLERPRVERPIPTLADAEDNFDMLQLRFRLLCVKDSRVEITELLDLCNEKLIDIYQLDFSTPHSAFCGAVAHGHISLLKYLTSRGFDLFHKYPRTSVSVVGAAIYHAAKTGSVEILDLLLRHGWDIGQKVQEYQPKGRHCAYSCLRLAFGNEKLCRFLLDRGADPNHTTSSRYTVVDQAAEFAPLPILKMLVESGGLVGKNAVVALAAVYHDSRVDYEYRPKFGNRFAVIEYLLDQGAAIDAYEYDWDRGRNALHIAIQREQADLVKLLLDRGADRELPGSMRRHNDNFIDATPLEMADYFEQEEIVALLNGENVPVIVNPLLVQEDGGKFADGFCG